MGQQGGEHRTEGEGGAIDVLYNQILQTWAVQILHFFTQQAVGLHCLRNLTQIECFLCPAC